MAFFGRLILYFYNLTYSAVLASLNTSSFRSKSSSVSLKKEDERLANAKNKNQSTNDQKARKGGSGGKIKHDPWHTTCSIKKKHPSSSLILSVSNKTMNDAKFCVKQAAGQLYNKVEQTEASQKSTDTQSEHFDSEPVVKSPPEPTRVKSPEQILMRSPDPVNWTVPLDTGKTFTVTQNVREGT